MRLSAELFEWMLSAIGSSDGRDGAREKRQTKRIALRGRIDAFILTADDVLGPIDLRVRDISAGGMRCEIAQHGIENGTQLILRLVRADDEPVMLLARAVRVGPSERGISVGLKFLKTVHRADTDLQSVRPLACAF